MIVKLFKKGIFYGNYLAVLTYLCRHIKRVECSDLKQKGIRKDVLRSFVVRAEVVGCISNSGTFIMPQSMS